MKRKTILPIVFVFATILLLMSFSKRYEEKMRGSAVAFFSPLWQWVGGVYSSSASDENETVQRLTLENQRLKEENKRLNDLISHEKVILSQAENLTKSPSGNLKNYQQQLLSMQSQAIPAHVIFRSPTSWNSSLWINVGRSYNDSLGKPLIVKNSPVLSGSSVVGVIDYVGLNQSRVRLITDPGLNPSVRALRIEESQEPFLLAKGELHGGGKPLWRSQGNVLFGIGFNYDFADEEGPSRDLRTGKPVDSSSKLPTMPIIKVNDILVTTGMDGVFPPGLEVAKVTKIHLLKEGDYYYELEAKPTAGTLDNLSIVFIIPPLGYDPADQPK
jgi:rod shape-determining protein MreC